MSSTQGHIIPRIILSEYGILLKDLAGYEYTGSHAKCATAVAASTGSACHAGHDSAPGVILAMGVPEAEALGTVRLTLGRGTTAIDVRKPPATSRRINHFHAAIISRVIDV